MAVKVVVAGLGGRGRAWAREVNATPGYELTACVDVNEEQLQRAAVELQIPPTQCFTNLEQALDHTHNDAVIVATSADEHVKPCEVALARKLAVLVEKPFTLHLSEAVKLVEFAETERVPLLVAQNYRYLRSFRTARRLIRDGALGHVGLVVCEYYRPPHDMPLSLSRLPHSVLWGMGVHHLDSMRHILGKEVIGVAAESFTLPASQSPSGASFRVMLTFEDETRGTYSATYQSSGHEFFERGQEFYARFVGERATLHVFQRWLILCPGGKLPRLVRRGRRKITEEQVLLQQLERAVVANETPDVTGRDNLQTMAVLEACVRSAAEQKWINPQDLLHEPK